MNKKSIVFTACALITGIGIGALIFGQQPDSIDNSGQTTNSQSEQPASNPEPLAAIESKAANTSPQIDIPPAQITPLPAAQPLTSQQVPVQPDNQYYELNATVSGYPIMVTGTPENPYSTSDTTFYPPGPNGLIPNPAVDPPSSYGRAYRTSQNFN